MGLTNLFKSKALSMNKPEQTSAALANDRIISGATTIGYIIEISNGYIITIARNEGDRYVSMYVPSLDKIGEALAAHKTKQKFLYEPETAYTTNKVKIPR